MIGLLVYILCAVTSGVCAFLLLRHYRRARARLLLWSGIAFVCFAVANILLFFDFVVVQNIDLGPYRNSVTLLGLAILLYGLVFQTD